MQPETTILFSNYGRTLEEFLEVITFCVVSLYIVTNEVNFIVKWSKLIIFCFFLCSTYKKKSLKLNEKKNHLS